MDKDIIQIVTRLIAGDNYGEILSDILAEIRDKTHTKTCVLSIKSIDPTGKNTTILADNKDKIPNLEQNKIVTISRQIVNEDKIYKTEFVIDDEDEQATIGAVELLVEETVVATIYATLSPGKKILPGKYVTSYKTLISHMQNEPLIYDILTLVSNFYRLRTAIDAVKSERAALINNIVNDLKRPLNGVITSLKQIEGQNLACEKTLRQSSQILFSIINDVTDLAAIESETLKTQRVMFALYECINEVVEIETVAARTKGIVFSVAVAPEVPLYVESDYVRLRQVLLTLIDNAIKYTESGSVTLVVAVTPTDSSAETLDLRELECNLYFYVIDSGCGIDEEKIDKIFIPFETNHDDRENNRGLSLSIARHLCKTMGGTIDVIESVVGRGTIMGVKIIANTRNTGEIVANKTFADKVVLVVHRDTDFRIKTCKQLGKWGISYIATSNIVEADSIYIDQFDFNVIITDECSDNSKKIITDRLPKASMIAVTDLNTKFDVPFVSKINTDYKPEKLFQFLINAFISSAIGYSSFALNAIAEIRQIGLAYDYISGFTFTEIEPKIEPKIEEQETKKETKRMKLPEIMSKFISFNAKEVEIMPTIKENELESVEIASEIVEKKIEIAPEIASKIVEKKIEIVPEIASEIVEKKIEIAPEIAFKIVEKKTEIASKIVVEKTEIKPNIKLNFNVRTMRALFYETRLNKHDEIATTFTKIRGLTPHIAKDTGEFLSHIRNRKVAYGMIIISEESAEIPLGRLIERVWMRYNPDSPIKPIIVASSNTPDDDFSDKMKRIGFNGVCKNTYTIDMFEKYFDLEK